MAQYDARGRLIGGSNVGGQNFGQVAPSRMTNHAGRSIPNLTRTDLQYFKDRAGQASSMQTFIGTTSAPSSAHQLSGFTPEGYAIWTKQAAPASAPAPAAPAPVIKEKEEQIAKLTAQSEAYRKQSNEQLSAAQLKISQLEDEDLQRQKAAELQNRLSIQAAASQARGQAGAQLKIQGASPTTQTAGTSAFKRRRDQFRVSPIQTTSNINVPSSSMLNI